MMKITELLLKDTVILDLQSTEKKQVIDELIDKLYETGKITDKEVFKQEILAREAQGSTGIGDGVAIPHAKSSAVKAPTLVFGRSKNGIDYESLDGQPAHLFFMIAATEGANQHHLDTLARLASMLIDGSFREQLLAANSKEEILNVINQKETEKIEKEGVQEATKKNRILAVTACPTGIAHTYMAADSLKEKAGELGVDIKVETRGSGGAKNVLTTDDIQQADAIIVAADT